MRRLLGILGLLGIMLLGHPSGHAQRAPARSFGPDFGSDPPPSYRHNLLALWRIFSGGR